MYTIKSVTPEPNRPLGLGPGLGPGRAQAHAWPRPKPIPRPDSARASAVALPLPRPGPGLRPARAQAQPSLRPAGLACARTQGSWTLAAPWGRASLGSGQTWAQAWLGPRPCLDKGCVELSGVSRALRWVFAVAGVKVLRGVTCVGRSENKIWSNNSVRSSAGTPSPLHIHGAPDYKAVALTEKHYLQNNTKAYMYMSMHVSDRSR